MRLCTRDGCVQMAVFACGFRAWAQGRPKTPDNCAEVLITSLACVTHSQEILALEFMNEPTWQTFSTRFKIAKGCLPAWSSAEGFIQEIASGKRTYRDDPRPVG